MFRLSRLTSPETESLPVENSTAGPEVLPANGGTRLEALCHTNSRASTTRPAPNQCSR